MPTEKKHEDAEVTNLINSFIKMRTPPEGQGNDKFLFNWSLLLIVIPFATYFLVYFENYYVNWCLHVYSLFMIGFYARAVSRFKEDIAHAFNPFDFVTVELIVFFNVILYFGFSYFFIAMVMDGQFNTKPISLVDSIYFSFVTVATLGYGDIHPVGLYGKLLSILEVCFGLWFVVTILPVAVAQQSERIRKFNDDRKEFEEIFEDAKKKGIVVKQENGEENKKT